MTQPSGHVGPYQHLDPLAANVSREPRGDDTSVNDAQLDELTIGQAWCLYSSYFLSMWNGRMYEFGAVSVLVSGASTYQNVKKGDTI